MTIKRFGENDKQKWYELADGKRITCDEETINILWCNWICNEKAKRGDTGEFTVYEFTEPIELDLETAERW